MSVTLALAAMMLGEAIEHRVTLTHNGAEVAATYRARVTLDARTIGAHTPNRPSRQMCAWTAAVAVERSFGDAVPRVIASDRTLRGTRPGACETARPAIAEEVARRSPAVRERLMAAADADRRALVAELDALRPNG